jgi:hypothetical protein
MIILPENVNSSDELYNKKDNHLKMVKISTLSLASTDIASQQNLSI